MAPNKVHLHFNPIARLIHTSELKGQRQYCPTKSMCASLNIRNCLKAQFRSQSMAGCCGVTEHESCGSNSTAEPWRWGRAWKQTWKLHKICCEGCCKICSSIFSSAAHTNTCWVKCVVQKDDFITPHILIINQAKQADPGFSPTQTPREHLNSCSPAIRSGSGCSTLSDCCRHPRALPDRVQRC